MIKNYLKEIEKLKSPISNEHTYRTPLENALNSLKVKLYPRSAITIQQETSINISDDSDLKKVFPDFTVVNEDERLIGFIECKDIDFDLHKAIEGKGNFKIYKEQLLKYLDIHNNLIYTNYIDFIHLVLEENQGQTKTIKIKNEVCLNKGADAERLFENIFEDFLGATIKEIDRKDYFLKLLARRTKILRDFINGELINNNSYLKNDIKGLFENTIFNDLSDKDFADAFSQIISFSLLFYRLSERKNVDKDSFRNMPEYIPIFREFLSKIDIENFNSHILYSIDSIINAVNAYNKNMFYSQFSTSTEKEDPFIYAYEYFLKEFDSKTRNARGVFYTPIEAVRYIIKSIDEILKDRLNIADGIYGEEVHILDFAAGTGTFMLGAIEKAFENAKQNGIAGVWENIVSDFILKRLYGFEFLIVPYVLAHFRIHEYLKDLNYDYKKNDRLQLYLTNTLDNSAGGQVKMFPQMQAESDNAYKIKNEEPILVIMGNPPYNNKSEEINRKEWIENLLKDYKENLNEKKINLDDDYIKFIRFAHWKMENAEKGIIGIIVNNSFISGVTHREMRRKLMQTFDEIYILDLHGNVNKGEKCPDGSMDFNIFNIKEVGVCIALFVKTGLKNNKNKGIYFNEVFGTQDYKKNYLIDKSIADEKWVELEDDKKWHWFTKVKSNEKYLNEFTGLHEIFNLFGSGCKTERDYITIHITEEELKNTILDFNNLSENKLTEKYNTKNSRDWSVDRAKKDIMENYKKYNFDLITKIHYRPFDIRYTYYTGTSKGFLGTPSRKIGYNFINRKNIGLIFPRQIAGAYGFQHGLVSEFIIDVATGGAKTGSETYFAPLYLYEENSADEFKLDSSCKPNWTDSFKEFLKNYISDNPKEILNYIYAILYSPTYRENYKEDLKYDYPRIPFTKDKKIFDRLQKLGEELIDLHLLKKVPQNNAGYPNKGEHKISYSKYNEVEKRLYINEKQYFENVKKEVYNYSIGGYKPIEKYIKAREILTLKDISHLIKVIAVIERTIYLQEEIDKVWREADF
ncbi:type ISP restriction/modification enzyme [Brachyspira aalborgi]|uniref:site-specific DNA-methyltransferase (adenine-specific) n=1 Tax=Brachyspira aalborgi TaxID=29522 RepID=A0A5C8G0J2_9SPIR|nr:type ISP restriction/modification enzyme [Brachyspira aalborgi]TXJ55325.1 adenine methyltransferase [Brachyspira aalborgi]